MSSCPYSTHLEITVASAVRSGLLFPKSTILELGCGFYSTPVLASIASAQARDLDVLSSNRQWLDRFKYLESHSIKRTLVEHANWPRVTFARAYGMVLVDNEQTVKHRLRLVHRLAQIAKVVVLHDANAIDQEEGGWHPTRRHYRSIYIHRRQWPHTAVLSNHVQLSEWFASSEPTPCH